MKAKILIVITLVLTGGGFGCMEIERDGHVKAAASPAQTVQDDLGQVRDLIKEFRGDASSQARAQERIIALSKQTKFRAVAIQELERIASSQNDHIIVCSQTCYEEWELSVETLGLLRADEAIDTLVDRLDFNNGATGLSLVWYPACRAVIKIGNPAIPKMVGLFSEQTDEWKRFLAIHTIHRIGTKESEAALRDILLLETNDEHKAEILRLLKSGGGKDDDGGFSAAAK